MTNQASEDELEHQLDDIVHDALEEVFCPDCEHPRCLNKVKLYKKAILALLRTEKLKLLAEVRERVVGNIVCTCGCNFRDGCLCLDKSELRTEQYDLLTKLEEEL